MKKSIIFTIIFIYNLIGIQYVSAQLGSDNNSFKFNTKEKVSWEIRVGANSATVANKSHDANTNNALNGYMYLLLTDENLKPILTYNIEVIINLPITQNIYFKTGLSFTNKGAKLSERDVFYDTNSLEIVYLQHPLLVSYCSNITDILKWNLDFGTYFAYDLLGATIDNIFVVKDKGAVNGGLNRFDSGLIFGAGIYFNKFYLGIQYDLGLKNILDSDFYGNDNAIKTRAFSINLGYRF
jgi:hypothetical protein